MIAIEHGGAGKATILYSDVGATRVFAVGRLPGGDKPFECVASVAVSLTDQPQLDADRALETLGKALLDDTAAFFAGRIEKDDVSVQAIASTSRIPMPRTYALFAKDARRPFLPSRKAWLALTVSASAPSLLRRSWSIPAR